MSTLEKKVMGICRQLKANFTLNNTPISYEEVFADTGLMAALARRADQLSSLCLGYGIGISFDEDENSLLGVKVVFDQVTPDILRLLCLTDVICELIFSAPSRDTTPMDELMYD